MEIAFLWNLASVLCHVKSDTSLDKSLSAPSFCKGRKTWKQSSERPSRHANSVFCICLLTRYVSTWFTSLTMRRYSRVPARDTRQSLSTPDSQASPWGVTYSSCHRHTAVIIDTCFIGFFNMGRHTATWPRHTSFIYTLFMGLAMGMGINSSYGPLWTTAKKSVHSTKGVR